MSNFPTVVLEEFINKTEVPSKAGVVKITSDLFQEGLNKVVVKASSSKGIRFYEWVVQKNKNPDCASTIPASIARCFKLSFDAEGNIYVAEYGAHSVRMVRRLW